MLRALSRCLGMFLFEGLEGDSKFKISKITCGKSPGIPTYFLLYQIVGLSIIVILTVIDNHEWIAF